MVTSVQFQSSYNVTYVGFTDQEMEDVDAAYGKALEYLRTVRHRLASANVEAGSVSADMALSLKHHFNLDVSVPKRDVGRYFQSKVLERISSVYQKIESDLSSGMTYHKGSASNSGETPRMNPKFIVIDPPFFMRSGAKNKARDLIHEQAHFASRAPGNFNTITDHGWWWQLDYYEINPRAYKNLTTEQALTNADCYAWFAWELVEPGSFFWDVKGDTD